MIILLPSYTMLKGFAEKIESDSSQTCTTKNKRQQAQLATKILTESKEKNIHHEDCQILEHLARRFFVIIILEGFQNFSGQQALSNLIHL